MNDQIELYISYSSIQNFLNCWKRVISLIVTITHVREILQVDISKKKFVWMEYIAMFSLVLNILN